MCSRRKYCFVAMRDCNSAPEHLIDSDWLIEAGLANRTVGSSLETQTLRGYIGEEETGEVARASPRNLLERDWPVVGLTSLIYSQ